METIQAQKLFKGRNYMRKYSIVIFFGLLTQLSTVLDTSTVGSAGQYSLLQSIIVLIYINALDIKGNKLEL